MWLSMFNAEILMFENKDTIYNHTWVPKEQTNKAGCLFHFVKLDSLISIKM